jgi:hypothetical protein
MLHARAIFLAVLFLTLRVLAKQSTPVRAISESRYTTAHSLGDNYKFDPRDGWQTVNVTNLQYKYPRDAGVSKPKSSKAIAPSNGLRSVAVNSVKSVLKGLKLIGESKPVTVTWYAHSRGDSLLRISDMFIQGTRAKTCKTQAVGRTESGHQRFVPSQHKPLGFQLQFDLGRFFRMCTDDARVDRPAKVLRLFGTWVKPPRIEAGN